MNQHKLIGATFFLLGIISLMLGIVAVLMAVSYGSAASQISMLQGGAETAAGLQVMFVLSSIFGILELLLGALSITSSVMLFKKKDDKPARKKPKKKR